MIIRSVIMRRTQDKVMRLLLVAGVLAALASRQGVDAFGVQPLRAFTPVTLSTTRNTVSVVSRTTTTTISRASSSNTALFAAKKKKTPAAAALEKLEALNVLDDDEDAPLSKKELKELAKKQKKAASQKGDDDEDEDEDDNQPTPKAAAAAAVNGVNGSANKKPVSKKEQMLQKALELDALDNAVADEASADAGPQLSKKELKELKKKEAKQLEKEEKKRQKKEAAAAARAEDEEDDDDGDDDTESGSMSHANGEDDYAEAAEQTGPTLEDKVRKDRPPPRIRVMESAQPGYTSLRLEGVSVTFRNQEVLKDVTWGVQTGDRIGLVGANGAGKTTQLRILAGELEPTAGDVVKSGKDLRVSMLRQEFIDELVPTRTLKEEMMSVFEAENKIIEEIKANEDELASADGSDPDRMQEILDRMQELQNEAEDKEVYVLESRVKKVMDLMGFTEDEGDDLVASFSGGWKMRIGLGKVLLREPNVLLLDGTLATLD